MLEIQVTDEVVLADSLEEVIEIVIESLKKWHASNETDPFTVSVRSNQNKAPPVLSISVSETVKSKAIFG